MSQQPTVNVTAPGFSLGGALFLLFAALKLTNHIDWSWWWVTAPLWVPAAVMLLLLLGMTLVAIAVTIRS